MDLVVISYNTWNSFKTSILPVLFPSGAASRGRYYFRGQGLEFYPLISSFDRWFKLHGKQGSKKDAEERFQTFFQNEACRLTPNPTLSLSFDERLALAQHYGVPTRLLDWSESPYIAAFFAFSGLISQPSVDARVAIWLLDTHSPIWNEDTGITLLSVPSPYNERLKSQLGKFTRLQSPFDTVEDHLSKCDGDNKTLRKIIIPASEAHTALSDLDFMGINYSTIYPGLDGCGRAANLRVLLGQ